jgi:hypothetical protein
MRKCAMVAMGAVSVVPQDEVIGMRSPMTRADMASRRCHRSCGSAAPA